MTLYELIENIKNLGKSEPNVSFVTQGDIYELNHQQDIDYPAFVVTQGTHFGSAENGVENYGLTLFLVDRLTSDKSNELDVQSWADTGLKNIISRIEEHNLGVIQGQYTVQTFTEKFDSLCAGAYVSLNIQVQVLECNCCENKINLVTSVNGKTGDVIIKGYEGSSLEHVNITEAEYNKLTEEQKMSNTVYFITDIQYVRYSDYLALEERVRVLEEKLKN